MCTLKTADLVAILVLLISVVPVGNQVTPYSDTVQKWGMILDPYEVRTFGIDTMPQDVVDGNFTAELAPLDFYIFYDGDFEYPRNFDEGDSIDTHHGRYGEFHFASKIEAFWILVVINENNLTQSAEVNWRIRDVVEYNLGDNGWAIIYSLPAVLIVICMIAIVFRRKR